jgi:hypothetical protein
MAANMVSEKCWVISPSVGKYNGKAQVVDAKQNGGREENFTKKAIVAVLYTIWWQT